MQSHPTPIATLIPHTQMTSSSNVYRRLGIKHFSSSVYDDDTNTIFRGESENSTTSRNSYIIASDSRTGKIRGGSLRVRPNGRN